MTEPAEVDHATRRDSVRRGMRLGGAVLAASALPLVAGARGAGAKSPPAGSDAKILANLTAYEQAAAVTYRQGLGTGALSPDAEDTFRLLESQEQEHADALAAAARDAGGRPPAPPHPAAVSLGPRRLTALRTQTALLAFALDGEEGAVHAYWGALKELSGAKRIELAAQVMANRGQHLVLLRQALGRPPVPRAFETGSVSR